MAKPETTAAVIAAFLVIFLVEVSSQGQGLRIDPSVRQLLVAEGGLQTLDCYVTLEQQISPQLINWTAPQGVVDFSTNTMTDNKLTYHNILTIDSFTKEHAGTYTCTFHDPIKGPSEVNIQLFTAIEDKIEGEYFYGNKTATLQCTLSFPDTSLQATFHQWLKDNVSLSAGEKFSDGNGTLRNGTLRILGPVRTDAGMYIARYNVTGADLKSTHDCQVEYIAAPLVMDMVKSKSVIEGDTVDLECSVKGYPPANITWLMEGKEFVVDGSRVYTESYNDNENAKLVIKSTTIADAGNYTCKATDNRGEWSAKSIRVRVKDRLDWLWPVIGILCEAVALGIVILVCSKIKKDDAVDKPADEREGLLRQGSARNREQDKHN